MALPRLQHVVVHPEFAFCSLLMSERSWRFSSPLSSDADPQPAIASPSTKTRVVAATVRVTDTVRLRGKGVLHTVPTLVVSG